MKNYLILLTVALLFSSCQKNYEKELKKSDLKDFKAKYSYMIGIDIGRNLKEQNVEIDLDAFIQGLKDANKADSLALLNNQELYEVAMQLNTEMQKQIMEKKKSLLKEI